MSILITNENKEQYTSGSYPDITTVIWKEGFINRDILQNFPSLNCFEYNGVCLFSSGNWLDLNLLGICSHLTQLTCSFNRITNLDFLINCPNLLLLTCDNNQIKNLKPLMYCQSLTSLNCSNNLISDISPLENCINLTVLTCICNQIKDLIPLRNHKDLNWLILRYNRIKSLEPIKHLKNLDCLDYYNNPIEEKLISKEVQELIEITKANFDRKIKEQCKNMVFNPDNFKVNSKRKIVN